MKYSDFDEQLKEITSGCFREEYFDVDYIQDRGGLIYATVSKTIEGMFSTESISFGNLPVDKRLKLVKLITKLSLTPIEDRKENRKDTPKFYLRLHEDFGVVEEDAYYNFHNVDLTCFFGEKEQICDGAYYQTIFTESELITKAPHRIMEMISRGDLTRIYLK